MFGFNKKTEEPTNQEQEVEDNQPQASWLDRLKQGLSRTRNQLSSGLSQLLLGKKQLDEELLEEIETLLLSADVGIEATQGFIEALEQQQNDEELLDCLRANMCELLEPVSQPLMIDSEKKPFVVLMVGINGAGKTTTIGKLAKRFQADGQSVMLAAGDTFRAAAVEQLKTWGERNDVPVVAQQSGADSASVIYDALQSAQAKKIDVLLADTAGRLHTKDNLMEELKKVKRVLQKLDPDAPHEVLLVLDAGTGQNALNQAKQFHAAVDVSGLVLTKLDGTAKGGIVFALAKQLGLPIRFIGVGEQVDDLRVFDSQEFVDALLEQDVEE